MTAFNESGGSLQGIIKSDGDLGDNLNFQLVSEVKAVLGTDLTPASGHPIALGTELEHFMMALGVLSSSLHLPVQLYFVLFALLITYNYLVLLFVSQIGL